MGQFELLGLGMGELGLGEEDDGLKREGAMGLG